MTVFQNVGGSDVKLASIHSGNLPLRVVEGFSSIGLGGIPQADSAASLLPRRVDYYKVYRSVPLLYAIVNFRARTLSQLPLKVFRKDSETGIDVRAEDGEGSGFERVLRNPGSGMSSNALIYASVVDMSVSGNALWRINVDTQGRLAGFRHIPWSRVDVSQTGDRLTYIEHRHSSSTINLTDTSFVEGERILHDQQHVVHFGFGRCPDSPVNDSPIAALRSTLALFSATYEQVIAFQSNGARPSGFFKLDHTMSNEAVAMTNKFIKEAWHGTNNAGSTFTAAADYQPLGSAPDQSAVIDLIKMCQHEICSAYGVSPPEVGILDHAIFSNVKEMRQHTLRTSLGPDAAMFAADLTAQVGWKRPKYNKVKVRFDLAASLQSDLESAAATLSSQLRIKTVNEMRGTFDLPPLDPKLDPSVEKVWSPNSGDKTTGAENKGEPATPGAGSDAKPEDADDNEE